jgi:four helix bundle protein
MAAQNETLNSDMFQPNSGLGERKLDLRTRTKDFALQILALYRKLPHNQEAWVIGKQLLRSGTSVGANYRAACRSRSKAEFVAKIGIVLEEADETAFWLELLLEAHIFPAARISGLLQEANELTAIFVSCLRTSKGLAG